MTNQEFYREFGNIDPKMIEAAAPAETVQSASRKGMRQKKKNTWVKWASIAAACFAFAIAATFITQYIPTEYHLNYSYIGTDGQETYIADKAVWIYYADNGDMERERVKLPCTSENVFIAWKHLNSIGSEVELIECKIVSNGKESTSEYEGNGIVNYEPGDYFILNITVSESLKSYDNQTALIESLQASMSGYSSIDFDEVHVLYQEQ